MNDAAREREPSARVGPLGWLADYARALLAAFGLLTRFPVPSLIHEPTTLGRSVLWFPLVGLVLGVPQALLVLGAADHAPHALLALAIVAFGVLATGALHMDGLADVFDGLGGSRGDPARALAVMRDSRIGSFGALALVLGVGAKVAAVEALLEGFAWLAVLLAPLVARTAVVAPIVLFRYARAEGLGKTFHERSRAGHLIAAWLLAGAIVATLAPRSLPALIACGILAVLLALWLARRLGGLTGDAYGAIVELTEIAFLSAALVQR